MKSEIGVSSFFGGSGFGIAEVGDGSGKDLGLAMGILSLTVSLLLPQGCSLRF